VLRGLEGWVEDDAVLYFEDGRLDGEIESFMAANAVAGRAHIALGTLWPRPKVFHVPAKGNIRRLAEIVERHAEPELAVHFHVYREGTLLVEWYDAFLDPMRVNRAVPEERVKALASALGTTYRREPE
jgi:hypothetical protein